MRAQIETRRFEKPDDRLEFSHHGGIDIVKLHDGTSGKRALLEPGWSWSVDEKPLLGNPDSCPMSHVGYCMTGEIVIRMVATAEERIIRQRDFFEIPPGTMATSVVTSGAS